jgi:hypothetical protein
MSDTEGKPGDKERELELLQKINDAESKLRDRMIELAIKNKDFLFDFEHKLIERWIRVTLSAAAGNGAGLVATILAIKDFKDVIGISNLVVVASIFSFGLILGGASYVTACLSMATDLAIATPYLEPEQRENLARPPWISKFTHTFLLLTFWASAGAFVLANLAIIRFLSAA